MTTPIIRSLSSFLTSGALCAAALYAVLTSQQYLSAREKNKPSLSEALYLPQQDTIKLLSFGYQKVASNYLWFKTINYFGKHYVRDQNYQWLFHMCTLVATLDPKALHVYEFGSTILAWEASQAALANELLSYGIKENPEWWKLHYLRGFNSYYFLNNSENAKSDFIKASQLPGAHPIVARLAAKTLATQNDPQQAIEFLNDTLKVTTDSAVRQVLLERLRELYYEDDLRTYEHALEKYQLNYNKSPNLIEELTPFLTRRISSSDPFGGLYKIGLSGQTIESTSNHKRLAGKK